MQEVISYIEESENNEAEVTQCILCYLCFILYIGCVMKYLTLCFKNFYFKKYGEIRITRVENSGI